MSFQGKRSQTMRITDLREIAFSITFAVANSCLDVGAFRPNSPVVGDVLGVNIFSDPPPPYLSQLLKTKPSSSIF